MKGRCSTIPPEASKVGFFSCHIKPRTFFLLFNFLLLHPRQVHLEARNLFPTEFVLVVLFGKGRLPRPWSPCAAERSRHRAAHLPICASPAPVKNTIKIKVTKMLLCCRKSRCFKAVGDKGALQGAGFPTLRAPVAGRRPAPGCAAAAANGWDRGKGEPWRWDAIAVLGESTSLDGKQSLPGDAERWPSWRGFCIGGHQGLPP